MTGRFNRDTPLVFTCLASITLLTTAAIGVVALVERSLLAWRPFRRQR